MKTQLFLFFVMVYFPVNVIAHVGFREWPQFTVSGYVEWLELCFVISGFIFLLLSYHFTALKRMVSRLKKPQKKIK